MSSEFNPSPVGYRVADYRIRGQEWDGDHRWVGADMDLIVPPLGHFLVRIVTKKQYANEELETTLSDLDNLNPGRLHGPDIDQRPPFVLNDSQIDDEVLERKFRDRQIEEDLAACLWYEGDK